VWWGGGGGAVAPAAVVFGSPATVVLLGLAVLRWGLPSPLTSPTATETGTLPVAKVCWGANEGLVAPAAVVFSSTDAVLLPGALATMRSGLRSPLTSPNATEAAAPRVAQG